MNIEQLIRIIKIKFLNENVELNGHPKVIHDYMTETFGNLNTYTINRSLSKQLICYGRERDDIVFYYEKVNFHRSMKYSNVIIQSLLWRKAEVITKIYGKDLRSLLFLYLNNLYSDKDLYTKRPLKGDVVKCIIPFTQNLNSNI